MLGAIIGDIVGSIYEFNNIRFKDFLFFSPRMHFTDDTIMTIAVYEALKKCKGNYKKLEKQTIKQMQLFGKLYPNSAVYSYGGNFARWLMEKNPKPYGSFGNGSAMRISPVAYFSKSEEEVKILSKIISSVSHNHEEGIKGAEATAISIFMAKNGATKDEIKKKIEANYYSLNFNYDDLVANYTFNETCQGTVPQAIYCFLISDSFEDAIRTGVSIGGDSDTLCAIIGAIAEAFYGIPQEIQSKAMGFLDKRMKNIINTANYKICHD